MWVCQSVFSSVTQSCPNLCGPMDCSMLVSSVLQYPTEFAQIAVSIRARKSSKKRTNCRKSVEEEFSPPLFSYKAMRDFYEC